MTVSLLDKWELLTAIMADPEQTASAKVTAFFLLDHFNTKTGRCDPSFDLLATESGIDRSTAIRGIKRLIAAGYFTRAPGGGRGVRTSYQPQWKTVAPTPPFNGKTVAPAHLNSGTSAPKTVAPTPPEYGKGIREEAGKCAPAPKSDSSPRRKYAFEGQVIRLTVENFDEWQKLYHGIPDLMAKLKSLDGRCAEYWPEGSRERKGWYPRVSRWLEEDHQKFLAAQRPAASDPNEGIYDGVYR